MSEEIIKILDDLGKRFGIAVDWSSDNVVPYLEKLCEKYINWEISTSIAWIVIMSIVAILAFIVAKLIFNTGNSDGMEWIFFILVLAISLIIIGYQVFDIIECKTFPEKAIYEYIRSLMKSN